ETQSKAFHELLLVHGIAASLVLVVLVVEFRSFTPSILILAAAPLSFGGALLMLLITGTELNVSSAMGFILLIGLVVKNGIVMIDYAHHLHEHGEPFQEAVEHAARIRLRSILMTTLCTLFGLLPLALCLGACASPGREGGAGGGATVRGGVRRRLLQCRPALDARRGRGPHRRLPRPPAGRTVRGRDGRGRQRGRDPRRPGGGPWPPRHRCAPDGCAVPAHRGGV